MSDWNTYIWVVGTHIYEWLEHIHMSDWNTYTNHWIESSYTYMCYWNESCRTYMCSWNESCRKYMGSWNESCRRSIGSWLESYHIRMSHWNETCYKYMTFSWLYMCFLRLIGHIVTHTWVWVTKTLNPKPYICVFCDLLGTYEMPALNTEACRCNTLRHATTRCNVLHSCARTRPIWGIPYRVMSLQHAATRCNTLQHTATYYILARELAQSEVSNNESCRYNTLHIATHCSTLQHIAIHCNILHSFARISQIWAI